MAFSSGSGSSSSCACDTGVSSSDCTDWAVSDVEQPTGGATTSMIGRDASVSRAAATTSNGGPVVADQDDEEQDDGYKASESDNESDSEGPYTDEESEEEGEPPDLRPLRAGSRHLAHAFLQQLKEDAPHLKEEAQAQAEVIEQCLKDMYGLEDSQDEDDSAEQATAAEKDHHESTAATTAAGGDGDDDDDEAAAAAETPDTRQDLSTPFTLQEVWMEKLRQAKITSNSSSRNDALRLKEKGNSMLLNGLFEDAVATYSKAEALDPANPAIYCNRAAAYTKLGHPWQAVSDCAMALTLDPRYTTAIARLGCAYGRLCHIELAQRCFELAAELDPEEASHKENLESIRKDQEDAENNEKDPSLLAKAFVTLSGIMSIAKSELSEEHTPSEGAKLAMELLASVSSGVQTSGGDKP
ncbi:uncharacterized protein LOC135812582 isoform X1 [Sycon ciliatum]|uniref:uncharacterized protein LOC135812582 isoform X1 n=1 Tax=Sycon ciliatum TaxID=27933 RepID=UPI0031F6E6E1